jgi:Zn-dependent protease with chaperone function
MHCQALAFGPGLPSTGSRGRLCIDDGGVSWLPGNDSGTPARLPVEAVALRPVGFGKPGVELSWDDGDGSWRLHVLDPRDAAAVLDHPRFIALPAVAALRQGARRRRGRHALGWSLLGLFLLSPLLLLLLFFLNADRIAAWAVDRIPVGQEMEFGRATFEAMRGDLKLIDGTPAAAMVQQLGQRLAQGSDYHFEFHLVDDPSVNAFALPGGFIVVHSGLVAATQRPEELAGVLAHEIEHVEQRHGLAALAKDLGWRLTWTLFSGDWGGGVAGEAALQLGSLKFSRDAERAADAAGLQRMHEAGIDPEGMADFFATLGRREATGATGAAVAGFLSTHPLSEEREAALRDRLRLLPRQAYPALPVERSWPPP